VIELDKEKLLINKLKELKLKVLDDFSEGFTLKSKVNCIDDVGYKYYLSYENIRNSKPMPFTERNPHTIHNIKLYLKTNKPNLELLSDTYTKAIDYNLIVQCEENHVIKTSWQVISRDGVGCYKCTIPNYKLKKEDFIKSIPNDYQLVGNYHNASTKVLIRHCCGHEYLIQPSRLLINKPKCAKCTRVMNKTTQEFKKEIFDKYKNEYQILEEYINSHEKILVKHDCGYVYRVTPTNLLSGKKCPKCSKTIGYSKIDFSEYIKNEANNEYLILSNYSNTSSKVKLKHVNCGNEWSVKISHFIHSRSRCPLCSNSRTKAEKELSMFIRNILHGSSYTLKTQYWFDDCRGENNNPYYFDYAIFDNSENLILLIERHGLQHYEFVKFIHKNFENYQSQLKRDYKKVKYCEVNNISLEIIEAKRTNYKLECQKIIDIFKNYDIIK